MTPFMTEDFLLDTEFARRLYHDYAKDQPIFDYHCHLPPQQVAENYRFKNLYDIWLKGDHYKWRAMRTNGVPERLCTGDASDREKFDAWAATVPHTIGNPLYHWTHLELRRPLVLQVSCCLHPPPMRSGTSAMIYWLRTPSPPAGS
jgi:glucuronate isomerase